MFQCIVTPSRDWPAPDRQDAFADIRVQLAEQARVLEARAEAAAGVASELGDYCRRRADLEHEYSRALDKLARAATQRHKDQKHKRDQWPLTGAFACWQAALDETRALARDHAALAELYGGPLAARLQRAADDVLRLQRRGRELLAERQEELGAALAEAAAAGKAHASAAAAWRAQALKLRAAHQQRHAAPAPPAPDAPPSRKLKALDKELHKRRARHSAARAAALRARADYVLSLEAANATLQRYYLDDVADVMLCTEVGYEAVVGRAVRTASAAEGARARSLGAAAGALLAAADSLDSLAARRRLLHAHRAAFTPPAPLPARPPLPADQERDMRALVPDEADTDDAVDELTRDLHTRLAQLESAARTLRAECREHAKTLDAAEAELVRLMEGPATQWEVGALLAPAPDSSTPLAAAATTAPQPDDEAPRRAQEDYYLAKFRSYVCSAGRLARLESKAAAVRARLLPTGGAPPAPASPRSPPRRRRGHFAPPLHDRLPPVLTSCVRVIATYGLRHQGIFRVSGSQVEMQALRAAFERGTDPLAGVRDASDINSVCGLLKLYLRELRPPLLPASVHERLLRLAAAPDDQHFVRRLRSALAALPVPSLLVLRYLFAFLAHLTEYSEHNMMDAWNLAICLGPTLLAAWGEGGAQVTAQNLVNELVKRIILHHRELFPQELAPHTLYRRPGEEEEEAGAEPDADKGAEACADDANAHALLDEHDGNDVNDDLSLYDDDDEDDDEEDEDDDVDDEEEASDEAEAGARRCAWRAADARERRGSTRRHVAQAAVGAPPAQPVPPVQHAPPAQPAPPADSCRRLAESTPDLVLDLPARAALAADALPHNRDALKQRAAPAPRHSGTDGGPGDATPAAEDAPGGDASPAAGSPVPARNTLRVAAKFAELTLTGGSLKPALAAKPALLRRPTPHPHARPAPPALPPALPAAPHGAPAAPDTAPPEAAR
ncbi:SLIT-ROBO Rho GTPase-activating protein 2-like isoform X2 [Battus philenor]|uniref:SLIT-ROBO Rho GTPase-activating protein 2-like isoform X2 n=1 Tax=Battus philenor TaxID=42288 RepID=UPI0035D0B18C